ncbi:hypothetical protein NC651_007357 [Populus alba x Populus x berolinensis]|nr:hypothetical protein NC651_007357 [Populus alba x Populus x berolinensis]
MLIQVDWCLNQEEARAELYPSPTTKTKILDVMKYVMLERNAEKWAQKRIVEGITAEDQELLSKYATSKTEESHEWEGKVNSKWQTVCQVDIGGGGCF